MLPLAPGVFCPALGASNLGWDCIRAGGRARVEDTTMSLHIRQIPPPRLSVARGAVVDRAYLPHHGTRGGFRKRCAPADLVATCGGQQIGG
jgi:hypothetical protein